MKKNNFAGAMVWTIDMDDYTGTYCNEGKYPLINVLKKGLGLESACECMQRLCWVVQYKTQCKAMMMGMYSVVAKA